MGNHWDRRGENEIDLIALDDFRKRAVVAEVKRNAGKIDKTALKAKTDTLCAELSGFRTEKEGGKSGARKARAPNGGSGDVTAKASGGKQDYD